MVYEYNKIERLIESLEERLDDERSKVDTNPTYGQIKAGNYRKGHLAIHGLKITIENPKGSYRKGKDKDGKEWKTLMNNDYGYFNLTVGKDGDAVDVFIGPNLNSNKVFPVDQFIGGKFDETKVMLGFDSKEEAKAAYLSNYSADWRGFKYITEVGFDKFKKWLYDGHRQRIPFAKYAWLNNGKKKLNESPDDCRICEYLDTDAFPFMEFEGKMYVGEPGTTHEELIYSLIREKKIPNIARNNQDVLYNYTTGRYWEESNVISLWDTPFDEPYVLRHIVSELSNIIADPKTLLVDIWDSNSCKECFMPYIWFCNGTLASIMDTVKNVTYAGGNDFKVETTKGTFYINYSGDIMTPYDYMMGASRRVCESKGSRKNDKGENVPEKCECGGRVCIQIHGEPVFICNKCGKYYGTLPFTNEGIDIKKALKNLKKRRDPANIENWDNDMINEAQGLKSKKLYDIFKQYGREFIAKHYDSSEAMDLHNVSDDDVVGVFKAGQLPRTEGEEKAWISKRGFDIDSADGVRNIRLGKFADDGQILYAVVINRNANYDRTSTEKDGGFKDYVNKQNARAEGKRGDGSRNYQWKDNDVKFDVMDNPYRKEWNKDAQQSLQDKMKATYGDVYNKVKNVSESKESDKEIAKALRRGSREADIEAHGKPVAFRPTITKNPKAYNRQKMKREKIDVDESLNENVNTTRRRVYLTEEQFKNYCRRLLSEKRKEDYIKGMINEMLNK